MSRTIDEKVVEMRFDNSNFEKNVSQSMSTLDKLKSALDFSGVEKTFSGLSSAADKVNFSGLGSAIDGVGQKFSALETMAVGALLNIGANIESQLVNKLKAVTVDQITAGFDKYAEKTQAVQTIMNATGEEIDVVTDKLKTLNWFTDETSYNFTDMTNNIGKFTSQSVELDDAIVAMEGISTAAALAGQNAASASRVMYNFSQSLGMGAVKVQDWMSVENANMATEEFKQTIIDTAIELGRLDKMGNINEILSSNYGGPGFVNTTNFRNTLAAGWFDDTVLIESLKKFGGFSVRLNEVYDQFNENYDVTTSQILQWLDAYMDGTLDIEEAVRKTGLTAEEILPVLKDLSSEEFDLGRRAFKAAQEAKTFEDVVNATADAVSTAWMNVFENIFGNYEEAKVMWTELSNELWDIFAGPISNLNDLLTDWHKEGGRDAFIESVKNMYRAVRSFIDPIGEAWGAIFPAKTYEDLLAFTEGLKKFSENLILDETRMGQIRMVFEDFFGLIKSFTSGFANGGGFGGFIKGVSQALNNATSGVYEFVLGIQRIRNAMEAYARGDISEFSFVQDQLDAYPVAAKLIDTYDKLVETLRIAGNTLGKLVDTTMFFRDGVLSVDSIIDGIASKIAIVLRSVGDLVHLWTGVDISETLDNIRGYLFDFSEFFKGFIHNKGWGEIKQGIVDIGTAFHETFGGIKEFFGPAWDAAVKIFNDWLEGIRAILGGTTGDLDGFFSIITDGLKSIKEFIETDAGFANFVNGIKGAIQFISDFLVKFLSLSDAIKTYQENGGGIIGLLAVINEKIKIVLDTFADLVQNVTGFDIHKVGDTILSVIQGIGYAILQVGDTVSKAFGWKDNPFGKLLGLVDEGFGGGPEGEGFNISGIFEKVGAAFAKLGEIVNAVAPGVSILLRTVGDAFKNLWELIGQIRLEDLIKIFQAIATIALTLEVKNTFKVLGDTLEAYQKKLRVDMLIGIAGAILMIAGAAFLISKIDAEKIGLVIGTLGTSFAGLAAVLVASKWGNAKVLASLPGTILSISVAMVILAKAAEKMVLAIDAFGQLDSFSVGFERLGKIILAFGGLLTVLGAINWKGGAVLGAAKALGTMTASLAVLYPILLAYSLLDWDTLAAGIGNAAGAILTLGGSLVVLAGLETLVSKFSGSNASIGSVSKSLITLAGALGILTVVMYALTKINGEEFFYSLLKLLGMMAAFAAGIALFSGALLKLGVVLSVLDKGGGLKAISGLVDILAKLSTTLLVLTLGTLALGLLSKALGDYGPELANAGVDLLVTTLDAIAQRAPEIAEDVVLMIVAILDAVASHTSEIVSYCVQIIGGIVQGIKDAMTNGGIDLGDFLAGGGILAGIIAIVTLMKKAGLTVRDFGAAALAIAGAALLMTEMGVLFAAIGIVFENIPGGVEGLKAYGQFCQEIVHIFTDDWGVLALFGIMLAFELMMSKFGSKLGGVKGAFEGFKTAGTLIAATVALVDELGALFIVTGEIINLLDSVFGQGTMLADMKKTEEFFDAIIGIFVGEDDAGNSHPKGGLIGLFIAIGAILSTLAALKISGGEAMFGALGTVASAIISAVAIIDLMGVLFAITGGVIEIIKGLGGSDIVEWVKTAGDFFEAISAAIGKFIGGLAGGVIQGFSDNVTETAINAVKAMADVALTIAESGLIANVAMWTGGPIGLATFAAEIGDMAPHFVAFAEGISGIPDDTVNKAAICAEALSKLIDAVPETGGIPAFFLGEKNLEQFGKGLKLTAEGIADYAEALADEDEASLGELDSKTEQVGSILAKLNEVTPETNRGFKWFVEGANDIGTFGKNLINFAGALVSYCNVVGSDSVNVTLMNNVMNPIKNLLKFGQDVAELGADGITRLTTFGTAISGFGGNIKSYYNSIKSIDLDTFDSITTSVSTLIDSFIGTKDLSLAKKATDMTNEFMLKMVEAFSGDNTKKQTESAADKFIAYFSGRFKTDTSIAEVSVAITDMVTKAIGKDELKEGLKQSGMDLANALGNGFIDAVDNEETGLKKTAVTKVNAVARAMANQETADLFSTKGSDLIGYLKRGMFPEEGVGAALRDAIVKFAIDVAAIFSEQVTVFQDAGKILAGGVVSGMTGANLVSDVSNYAKNVTDGFANTMRENANVVQQAVQDTIVNTTKNTITAPANGKQGGFAINSPSRWAAMAAEFVTKGFVNSMYDGIPNVKEAVSSFVQAVKDEFDYNSLIEKAKQLGFDKDGGFADLVSNYISSGVTNLDLDESTDDFVNQLLSGVENNEIFSGSGTAMFDEFMNSFADSYYNSVSDITNMGTDGLDEYMNGFTDYTTMLDGTSVFEDNMTSVLGEYNNTIGDVGAEGGYTYVAKTADSMISAAEEYGSEFETAGDIIGDKVATPIENRLADTLSYVQWLANEYPNHISMQSPVYDFDDLKLEAGEIEALMSSFDMLDDLGKSNLIRQYGADYGREDVANFLRQYWNNQPLYEENQRKSLDAILGYQTYLEAQQTMAEQQVIQQQAAYDGVQQIAASMQEQTTEANAQYMAALEEIKMNVNSIREELNGVHADIEQLNTMDVYIDSDALVGATAGKYNEELGNLARIGQRGVTR